jgi:hypothetical protein
VSVAASVVLLAIVLLARPHAIRYAYRHFRLLSGAVAERRVGETLEELRQQGWDVRHDIEQRYEGNIDHLASGPNGVYLIETKAHRYRDKDLAKVRRQAAKVHDKLGVWVTPVICLDDRQGRAFRADRVWIVPRQELLTWLRGQRNKSVEFGRLGRFTDSP